MSEAAVALEEEVAEVQYAEEVNSLTFLSNYGPDAMKKGNDSMDPLHRSGDQVPAYPFGEPLFPGAQTEAGEAARKLLFTPFEMDGKRHADGSKSCFLVVEPGGGKTHLATWVTNSLAYDVDPSTLKVTRNGKVSNIVVLSPPIMIDKWRRTILRLDKTAQVIICNDANAMSTVARMPENTHVGNTYWIIGQVRNRMHMVHEDYFPTNKQGYITCPRCGELLLRKNPNKKSKKELIPVKPADLSRHHGRVVCHVKGCGTVFSKPSTKLAADLDECHCGKKFKKVKNKLSCECGNVVQLTNNSDQLGRTDCKCGGRFIGQGYTRTCNKCQTVLEDRPDRTVSPSNYLFKKLKKLGLIDIAIVDEAHDIKGNGPQGKLAGALIQSAKKSLLLTGTLTGGYAENLWHLFWRAIPARMRKEGFSHQNETAFVRRFGSIEERILIKACGEQLPYRPRRVAGISAQVYTRFLMPVSIFMQLAEMGINMPPYTEHYHGIKMDADLAVGYYNIDTALKKVVDELKDANMTASEVVKICHSSIHHAYAYLDCPRDSALSATIKRRNKAGKVVSEQPLSIPTPGVATKMTNKLRKSIEIALDARSRGEKTLFYVNYTDYFDCIPLLQAALVEAGLTVQVLRSETIAPDRREAWIRANCDVDCLIVNPECVKVGLDLPEFPNVVWFQSTYNIYTYRQASYRPWRPGQKKAVNVHVLVYEETVQETAICLIASKLDSALIAEGIINDSDLFKKSSSRDSVLREMAKAMLQGSLSEFKLPTFTSRDVDNMLSQSVDDFLNSGTVAGETAAVAVGSEVGSCATCSGSTNVVLVSCISRVKGKRVRSFQQCEVSEVESGQQFSFAF